MHDALFLGADVGTTAVKVGVFDQSGAIQGAASRVYETRRRKPGWAEHDPRDWWDCLVASIDEIAQAADLRRVASLGVCSQVNTHVFVDTKIQPLLPAIVWQDQRCADTARRLDVSLTDEERDRLWGGPFTIDSSFGPVRLAWLAENDPAIRRRVRWVLQPKDYVNWCLTGRVATDFMSPVGVVGRDRTYLPAVLDLVDGAAAVHPPIRDFTAVLGKVMALKLPVLAGAVVAVGTMDAWGSIYGSGLVEHGIAMDVCGTSEIVAIASQRSKPTAGVISFPPLDSLYLHAGPTQAGGDALRWWADGQRRTLEEVLDAAAEVRPGSTPLFHPYLAGERAPLWEATATAGFFGVGADHDFRHFSRSVLEGVAFSTRHVLEELEKAAEVEVAFVNESGGGSRSDLWCQIKAEVLGRDVRRLRVVDSGVLGAGLIGAVAAGLYPNLRAAVKATVEIERTFSSVNSDRTSYQLDYGMYRQLYDALRPSYETLASRLGAQP